MDRTGLRSYDFRRERERTWAELERLIEHAEQGGLRRLTPRQLARLPLVYRATLSALSVARAISLDRALLGYLESLCARAYFAVYGSTTRLRDTFGDFFLRRFPATVRRHMLPIGMAGLFLVLGAVVAWVLTARDMDWFYVFVDAAMAAGRDPAATTDELRATLYDGGRGGLTVFASFLFTHNARVGFLAFSLGFLAGVPVYLLLFTNGMILGAFAALYSSRGLGPDFWGWVLPHGVTELWAIVLCGGAGLMLGNAIIFPGRHTRLANLARQGREAGVIVLGCVALFLVAGLIEGYFRQLVTDTLARYMVVLVSFAGLCGYFGFAGRRRA